MRLIKAQNTNLRNIYGKGIKYDINGQIIMDSTNAVLVPTGTTAQRPENPQNGHIRYNTETNTFEMYENDTFKDVRFQGPSTNPGIIQQDLSNGDADELVFGPLDNQDPNFPTPLAGQNILVFVENVFQIHNTNYELVQNPGGPFIISNITSIDGTTGYPTIVTSTAHGLTTGDIVAISGVELPGDNDPLENLNIGDDSSSPFSVAVTVIDTTTLEVNVDCTGGTPGNYDANSGKLYLAGSVTGPYLPGWYIRFYEAPPIGKPVTVLHNFDK